MGQCGNRKREVTICSKITHVNLYSYNPFLNECNVVQRERDSSVSLELKKNMRGDAHVLGVFLSPLKNTSFIFILFIKCYRLLAKGFLTSVLSFNSKGVIFANDTAPQGRQFYI